MKGAAFSSSRLAFRHLLVVVLVTVLFSTGTLFYQFRMQYTRGVRAQSDVLETIEESYLPPVAAGVFFFDDHQLRLLAEGIALLPHVESVVVFERRYGEHVPLIATGDSRGRNGETREYPLVYDHDGTIREVGALHVTTSLDQFREQILEQIRLTTVANVLKTIGFALVILVVVQRMVFRHLRTITAFVQELDPEHPADRTLILARSPRNVRSADEFDEITEAINTTLVHLDRTVKEKQALLQELYHRTGNMMQSIRAILQLQSSRSRDNKPLQAMVRSVDNRILAMALVHQKLYQRRDLSRVDAKEYLDELIGEIYRSYTLTDRPVRLQTDIEEISLLIDTAIPCGMVLCELLSNSLQHAFPDRSGGAVSVTLRRTGNTRYLFTVADDGIGVGSDFDIRRDGGIGIQSVIAIVEAQLRGSIEFDRSAGVRWEILFSGDMYRERVPNG